MEGRKLRFEKARECFWVFSDREFFFSKGASCTNERTLILRTHRKPHVKVRATSPNLEIGMNNARKGTNLSKSGSRRESVVFPRGLTDNNRFRTRKAEPFTAAPADERLSRTH